MLLWAIFGPCHLLRPVSARPSRVRPASAMSSTPPSPSHTWDAESMITQP